MHAREAYSSCNNLRSFAPTFTSRFETYAYLHTREARLSGCVGAWWSPSYLGVFGTHRFSSYLPSPVYMSCAYVRVGRGSDIYTCFRTYAHTAHQVVYYSVQQQKPIPSFRSGTLAGHLRSYVYMSGFFRKCRTYTHQNGSGHIHGGG